MKPEAVFFDLDGTLVDTALDMGQALNTLLERHARRTLPHEEIRPHVSHGANALLLIGFGELGESDREALRQEYLDIYSASLAERSCLFEEMDEVLDTIEQRGLPWGVVTNKPGWLTEPLLKSLALFDRCVCVVSADTCSERKPHPMPMYYAAEKAQVAPEHCLYIGDAERDIVAGRAAGMSTLAAQYGYLTEADNPLDWNAGGIIERPSQILNFL